MMPSDATWLSGPTEFTRYESTTSPEIAEPAPSRVWPARLLIGCVLGMVLMAPLPFGSHQGVAWLAFACFISVFATVYFAFSGHIGQPGKLAIAVFYALFGLALFATTQVVMAFSIGASGTFGSDTPRDSLVAAMRLAGLAIFALGFGCALAAAGLRRKQVRQIMSLLCLTSVVYAAGSLVTQGTDFSSEGGLIGPFANRNTFATFLGMGLVLTLVSAIRGPSSAQTRPVRTLRFVINWTAVVTLVIALVATQSRMGMTATAVASVAVILLQQKKPRGLIIIAMGLLAIVAMSLAGVESMERFSVLSTDWQTRLEFYQQIMGMIADRPLAGFGADGFALAFESYHKPPVTSDFVWDRAHSTYLKMWVELGLVAGSVLPIGGIVMVALLTRRSILRPSSTTIAATGCTILVGIHSTVDFSLEILANQLLFVAILVLADHEHNKARQPKGPQ